MQMIQSWFNGGPSGQASSQPSLLADWNSYAASQGGGQGDLEAGDAFAPLLQMGKSAGDTISGAFSTVQKNVQALPGSVHQQVQAMPSQTSLFYFGALLGTGVFLVFIAFSLFLPVMVVMPQKFAITFTLGCVLIMGAFFVLKGPAAQLKHMLSMERAPFTAVLVGSMAGTLYASMFMHSYLLSLLFSGIQVVALAYYGISYFPGGATGMRFIGSMAWSAVTKCFGG